MDGVRRTAAQIEAERRAHSAMFWNDLQARRQIIAAYVRHNIADEEERDALMRDIVEALAAPSPSPSRVAAKAIMWSLDANYPEEDSNDDDS